MKTLLDILLPRLFPDLLFQCVPHDGKNDLERSIPPHPGMGRPRATPPHVGFLERGLQDHSGSRRTHLRVGTAHGPEQLGAPATLFDR